MVMVIVAIVFGLTALGATILGFHQSLTIERLREENCELRHTLRDAVDDLCDAITGLSESMQDEYDDECATHFNVAWAMQSARDANDDESDGAATRCGVVPNEPRQA